MSAAAISSRHGELYSQPASISRRVFGQLPGGEPVDAWVLTGTGGLVLECISYGAAVTRLLVPDRQGRSADVVLGFQELEGYLQGSSYFGGMVGRVAGRTPGARYRIDGATYQLAANDGPNHLHGGVRGFDKKLWSGGAASRDDGAPSLRLELTSPDGEEGHPGTVGVSVTYTVTHDNSFLIETQAVADRPTPLSMAHHSYFNLAGESHGTIRDHELQVRSDRCIAVDEQMVSRGFAESLVDPGNDLRSPRLLGPTLPHLFRGHGDLYQLRPSARRGEAASMSPAARLVHPPSGRIMEVATSEQYLQIYTASALHEARPGKSGFRYGVHSGICLECEGYPDGVNHPELGDILLRPGEIRREATAYTFSNRREDVLAPRPFDLARPVSGYRSK